MVAPVSSMVPGLRVTPGVTGRFVVRAGLSPAATATIDTS